MGSNPITDVSSLVDLDKLYYIHFRNTRIKDLTPFLELESLESLNINDNKIDLRKGTENLKVVNTLIEKGVNVEYKRGNTY
jgi:Leucine-rich repeat (LRR) protein